MADSDFGKRIEEWSKRQKGDIEKITRLAVFKVFARIVKMSPVGNPELWAINATAAAYNNAVIDYNDSLRQDASNLTKSGRLKRGLKEHDSMDIKAPKGYTGGRFRGNWQIGIDATPSEAIDNIDKTGNDTISTGKAVLETFKVGTTHHIFIANNLPYARALEYGHSSQAPNGMVRITVMEFNRIMREAGAEIRL